MSSNEIDNFEIDPDTVEERYCELIDETPVDVCGISFDASRILRELDPTAYNCGLSDFAASLDPMDESEEYAELEDELEELNDELEELNDELEELVDLENEFDVE